VIGCGVALSEKFSLMSAHIFKGQGWRCGCRVDGDGDGDGGRWRCAENFADTTPGPLCDAANDKTQISTPHRWIKRRQTKAGTVVYIRAVQKPISSIRVPIGELQLIDGLLIDGSKMGRQTRSRKTSSLCQSVDGGSDSPCNENLTALGQRKLDCAKAVTSRACQWPQAL
jgi:hypothetical protein